MKRTALWIAVLGVLIFAEAAHADWTPAKRLTWTSGNSTYSAIATDSNHNIYVAWDDDTAGNFEIYYKKEN
jgi:hypothetical protein